MVFTALLSLQPGLAQQASPESPIAADPSPDKAYIDLVRLFDYPQEAPLNVKTFRPVQLPEWTESNVQFDDPLGGRPILVSIVEGRDRKAPMPAVVFGAGSPAPWIAKEMRFLASLGAVAVSLPSVSSAGAFDYAGIMRHSVVALRRVYDYLAARGDIDLQRVCAIGFSTTAIVAAIDPRFRCFVFSDPALVKDFDALDLPLSPDPTPAVRQKWRDYVEAMRPYNVAHYVGHIKAPCLIQSGESVHEGASVYDHVSPDRKLELKRRAQAFYEALDSPKEYKWYEAPVFEGMGPGNHIYSAPVIKDKVRFLREQLGLGAPTRRLCSEFEWPAICAEDQH